MPLTETYPKGTVFVGRKVPTDSGGLEAVLAGTGFLVMIDGATPFHWHTYIVTAAHVVDDARESFVRVTTAHMKEGEWEVQDVEVPEWVIHSDPTKDVAVAPIRLPDEHHMVATGLTQFIDDEAWASHKRGPWDPELGEDVYFVGMLAKIESMTMGNVPMVRSGTLGRLWQERCPVATKDRTVRHITAHLIDCRSFNGFSGSPCYIQEERAAYVERGITTEYRTALLGMVGGHYDDWLKMRDSLGVTDVEYAVNTGVGYVIPAEYIRDTLMSEVLVEMRKDEDEKRRNRATEEGATQDAAPETNEPEFERFEDLTRKLVNTPKPETPKESEG